MADKLDELQGQLVRLRRVRDLTPFEDELSAIVASLIGEVGTLQERLNKLSAALRQGKADP